MKYLRPLLETMVPEDPADVLNLEGETDYSALSADELMVFIDQAAAAGNFKEVERLNAVLRKELKGKPEILDVGGYVEMHESVAEARAVLKGIVDAEVRRATSTPDFRRSIDELPAEEREAAEGEAIKNIEDSYYKGEDFTTIQRLFASRPKYIGPFTIFRFVQGASMSEIEQIADLMTQFRSNLDDLEKQPEEYAKEKVTGGDAPPYEKLADELNTLLKLSRGRWIVKALPKLACSTPAHVAAGLGPVNLRELYSAAPKEKKNRLLELGAEINDLDKPNLINAIRLELSGKPTIDAIIDDLALKVASANTDRGELYEKAMASYPGAAVLYNGPDHMVFSFRSDATLPILCGKAKSWCIQPAWYNPGYAGRFWSYANGSLQLGILDFTVDSTHNFHTVGWTIRPDGSVTSVCNQPNRCNSGDDYRRMMRGWSAGGENHSYPQEVIDAISLVFDEEVKFKTSTDEIYKKIYAFSEDERDRSEAMKKTILGLVRNVDDLVKSNSSSFGDINSRENINTQVIAAELKNLRNSEIALEVQQEYVSNARNKGLISPADVKIFEIVMEGSKLMTPQLIKNIIDRNALFVSKIEFMVSKATRFTDEAKRQWDGKVQSLRDAIAYLDSILLKNEVNNEEKQD
jgi:hypothetical protein